MKTKTIKQSVTFDADSKDVYEAILDAKKHAAFTGAAAKIENIIDGKFIVYDGYCHGYNIDLVRNKKIVQAWHFAEDGWPEDHFSICTFLLEENAGKTKLTFIQTGIPENKLTALSSGWREYYWKPLKNYLKNKQL